MHPCLITHRIASLRCDIIPDYDASLFEEFALTSVNAARNSGRVELTTEAESNAQPAALRNSPTSRPSAAAMNSSNAERRGRRAERTDAGLDGDRLGAARALCAHVCGQPVRRARRVRRAAPATAGEPADRQPRGGRHQRRGARAPAAALVETLDGEWPFGQVLCKAFIFSGRDAVQRVIGTSARSVWTATLPSATRSATSSGAASGSCAR